MSAIQTMYTHMHKVVGGKSVEAQNKRLALSMNGITRASRSLHSSMMGTGRLFGTATIGLATLGLAVRRVTSSYETYTESVTNLRTTLAASVDNYREATRMTSALAEATSRELGYSVSEANDAMNTLVQAGLGVHRSMRVYEVGMQLARVANIDTGRTQQFLVDSMNMFRDEMTANGEELQHFSRRMASQLSAAANAASTNIGDLQQAFKYAGGELSGFGYQSREVISMLAAMSAQGIRSTAAGTRLRGAIAALSSPSKRTIEIFDQFGIKENELKDTFYDLETGALRPLQEGVRRMGQLFGRMQQPMQRNTALMRLYGRRALVAGMSLSDMGESAQRFHQIYERLGDAQVRNGELLDTQVTERMQSFGMQMTQLRSAIDELAIGFGEILFGSLKTGSDGFGTYARNVMAAMRLSGDLANMTPDQRRQWESLTEEQRNAGKELRSFMVDMADSMKIIAKAIIGVSKFAMEHKRFIPILIGTAAVLHPTTLGLIKFAGAWMTAGTAAKTGGAAMRAGGTAGALGAALILQVGGVAAVAVNKWSSSLFGVNKEMEDLRRTTIAGKAAFVETIPVVGGILSQFVQLLGVFEKFVQIKASQEGARAGRRVREGGTAEEMMRARENMEIANGREVTAQSRGEIARQLAGQTVGRMTALFAAREQFQRGISGGRVGISREFISEQLREGGMQGQEVEQTSQRIFTNLQNDLGAYAREAEQLGYTENISATNTGVLVNQLEGFNTAMVEASRAMEEASLNASAARNTMIGISTSGAEGFGRGASFQSGVTRSSASGSVQRGAIRTAGDAYVQRGGVMGVSSGDIVVSRTHLADAMMGSRGSMVPSIMGGGNNSIQPPGGSGGGASGPLTADVPIVLQIDGKEIARTVGRAHLRHLERSGTGIQPGQRRTLAESGFSESRR